MKRVIPLVLSIHAIASLVSCQINRDAAIVNSSIPIKQKQIQDIKDAALCRCIYKEIPLTQEQVADDGSLGGYVMMSDAPIPAFEDLHDFVQSYLDTIHYESATNANLGMMKCINFYRSQKLHEYALKYTNE